MMRSSRIPLAAAVLTLAGCVDPSAPERLPGEPSRALSAVTLSIDTLETGLVAPVFVTHAPGDWRLFIVQKNGLIRLRGPNGLRDRPFLNLRGQVSTGSEQGLLGLAFHPDYDTNRRLYVNYTDLAGDTRIVEYTAFDHTVDPASARLVLHVDQPADNHNGGMLAFGPDGYLYIALGDGGGGNIQNGQLRSTLLGKILRIDVDGALPYAVPGDNPFVGQAGIRPEIWHYGLRNPWRFSFDDASGAMWIADVGQNTYEEVNVVRAGKSGTNFGWAVLEGPDCFNATTCDETGKKPPRHWYTHDDGCSITGGYVYRGALLPELRGAYFFGDFCTGTVWSFRLAAGGGITELTDWTSAIGTLPTLTSFGVDHRNELYAVTRNGLLVKFVSGT